MKAVKAIYQNGQITLSEPLPDADPEPVEVLVVFPEEADDPWQKILDEPAMRPSFAKFMQECEKDIAQGKAQPLDLSQL